MIRIAGYSESFISLVVECYHHTHPDALQIHILQNVPHNSTDIIPFAHTDDTIVFESEITMNDIQCEWYLGVGQPRTKRAVVNFLTSSLPRPPLFPNLFDPSSRRAHTSQYGDGNVVLENVVVGPFARLRDYVTLNRLSSIGHHTSIGSYCTVSPGVHIAGHCVVEEGVFLGIGAVVCDHVTIGKHSVIGAGSVVTKSIPENVIAYGNPARLIRKIDE
jgi:sugar O-acyltransferase (sialic acid O-acetyltransferase NeuD family)